MLNDISSADFSNNYNSLISGGNESKISNAAALSSMKQSANIQAAKSKLSSDSDKDILSGAQDAFSGAIAGNYVDNKVLRGVYEAGGNKFSMGGLKTYAKGRGRRLMAIDSNQDCKIRYTLY